MKNVRVFLSENFQFLELKFSIYLNRRVFVMVRSRQAVLEKKFMITRFYTCIQPRGKGR